MCCKNKKQLKFYCEQFRTNISKCPFKTLFLSFTNLFVGLISNNYGANYEYYFDDPPGGFSLQ